MRTMAKKALSEKKKKKKMKCFVVTLKLFLIESLAQIRIKVSTVQMWDTGRRETDTKGGHME